MNRKSIVFLLIVILFLPIFSGCIEEKSGATAAPSATTQPPTTTTAPTTTPPPQTTLPPTTTMAPSATALPTTTPSPTTTPPPTTSPPATPLVYYGYMVIDNFKMPQIMDNDTLFYLVEKSKETATTWGEYSLYAVNILNLKEKLYATFFGDERIVMMDNGAMYVPVEDEDYNAFYWDIKNKRREDLILKSAEGHYNGWLVYILKIGSYKQVLSIDVWSGKSYTITTSKCNKNSPRAYGATVVFSQYNQDWDLLVANITGGGERTLSSMSGDELDPRIDGRDVIYVLDRGTSSLQLYYVNTNGTSPVKLCDNVGNYIIKDRRALFYDYDLNRWIIALITDENIVLYAVSSDVGGDSNSISVSNSWVFVNGYFYKIE
ncbi:MAG: TolB family protein [Candidatus Methanofastidiosia archaeon]